MNPVLSLTIIIVSAMVTLAIRWFPFLVFRSKGSIAPPVEALGKTLPFAVMGVLIIYCLRNVDILSAPHGLAEALAMILVIGLHLWKRNNLISIGAGTIFYMFLVQQIFA